jgi:hypothetical protein
MPVTEDEWLVCTDPERMLQFLSEGSGVWIKTVVARLGRSLSRAWSRKLLLLLSAGCRSTLLEPPKDILRAVVLAERYADLSPPRGFRQAMTGWWEQTKGAFQVGLNPTLAAWLLDPGDFHRAWGINLDPALIRDLFNPFRAGTADPTWLCWNGGIVVKLVQSIYDNRRFEDMPVLADALEEAGCDNQEILSHCRGGGPHARGCWLLDMLLGKW